MSNVKHVKRKKVKPPEKTENIGFRLSPELDEKVSKYAVENELTRSQVARLALARFFNEQKTSVASK
jgi:predicted transcriptional regulator